jgi:hypothetical protein
METLWIKINSENDLPEEGKYVLARHNRGTWRDKTDQENVNCVVVKLVRGISMNQRELMRLTNPDRARTYRSEDEHGNNQVPYNWNQFGPDSFFGQTITHWMPIHPVK